LLYFAAKTTNPAPSTIIFKNTAAHMDFCDKMLEHVSKNYTPSGKGASKDDSWYWLQGNIGIGGASLVP
jgi:hypothetical protein